MNLQSFMSNRLLALAPAVIFSASLTTANATEPCEDLGECKVLIEMNATDGDIGFHFLMDGDDLVAAKIFNPDHLMIFRYRTRRELREQFLTETFAESAEPLCWDSPDAEEDDEIVTLEEFLGRWTPGTYHFHGIGEDGELTEGHSELTFDLPAAPKNVEFEGELDDGEMEFKISWEPGDDLGNCANFDELVDLVADGTLPTHPKDVEVAAWEVVLEPDVEDGNPLGSMVFVVRIPGDAEELEIEVPNNYLKALPDDTLAKVEVGAIGVGDNATFTEIFDICLNEDEGCDEEDEEDE